MAIDISEAVRMDKLRGVVENLITDIYKEINFESNVPVIRRVAHYEQLRGLMADAGIDKEDITWYDTRFINLPWKACGYEVPNLI